MSNVMMFCPTCSWLCHVWHTLAHVTVKEKRSIRARSVVPRITTGNTGGTRRPIRQRPLRACTNFHCRDIVSCPCTGTLPQPIFKSVILFYQNSHWFGFIQDMNSIIVPLSLNNSLQTDLIEWSLLKSQWLFLSFLILLLLLVNRDKIYCYWGRCLDKPGNG